MVVNYKKTFILCVLVLMFAMVSQSVLGSDTSELITGGFRANLTGVHNSNSLANVNNLKSGAKDHHSEFYTGTRSYYSLFLKNGTYTFNITVYNENATASKTINITEVAITLPAGMTYGGGNSTYTNEASSNVTIKCDQNGQTLNWTQTTYSITGNDSLIQKDDRRDFIFNVTVATSTEGYANFTVIIVGANLTSSSTPANNQKIIAYNFGINQRIYLDGVAPTFDSAKTDNSTSLNLTFSEAINQTTLIPSAMYIAFINKTGTNITISVSDSQTYMDGLYNGSTIKIQTSSMEGNWTPYVRLNVSTPSYVTDLAGNAVAANTSVTATDGAPPILLRSLLNFTSNGIAILTLIWSEPVTAIGTTIGPDTLVLYNRSGADPEVINATSFTNVSTRSYITIAIAGNMTQLTFTAANSANISFWRTTGFNLTLNASAFKDFSDNILTGADGGYLVSERSLDTTGPNVISWTYSHTTKQLVLTFNEYVDPTYYNIDVNLSNSTAFGNHINYSAGTGLRGSTILLEGTHASLVQTHFATTLALNLTSAGVDAISALGASSTYLYLQTLDSTNNSFKDAAGNNAYAFGYGTANSYLAATTWTKDTTVPTATVVISDANVTGPGIHRLRVTFSENMSNVTTITLTKDGTAITPLFNYSFMHGTPIADFYYNFTTADTNAEWVINLSGAATDLANNALVGTNTGLKFTYDSVAPYVLYSYFLDNGTFGAYNGTLNDTGDTLIFVFSEPLQPRANFSIGRANFSFRDGDLASPRIDAVITNNRLTLTLNKVTDIVNLSLRGEWSDLYNATAIQETGSPLANRNLNKNSSSWFIRDKADNFARAANTPADRIVVADYAFTIVNATPYSISFPTCVNTGNMTAYLNANDYSFEYYYNTATWASTSVTTSLRPLVGYRFTWIGNNAHLSSDANDDVFRVYLKSQSDCALSDLEISVKDGWNYLALNGNYYNTSNKIGRMSDHPDNWLASLSSDGTTGNIQVGSITKYYGNTSSYSNGARLGDSDWDALTILPYTAWWVQSTAANTLTGIAART